MDHRGRRPGMQRQNSFLSPINNTPNYSRRNSLVRSSLVHSPERVDAIGCHFLENTATLQHDKKRRRLSLLPSHSGNIGALGAPRLLNQAKNNTNIISTGNNTNTSTRRQSISHTAITSNTNHQTMLNKNVNHPGSVQDLVQQSINKMNPRRKRDSTLPSSASSGITPPTISRPKSSDPRPIRSHRFQSKIQDELFQFLSNNKFDIEMKITLTTRTLKNPTQKEFLLIFQWLYKQLDPGFKFNRIIEQDIYTLLKFLEYPYLDSINKSQISAVGGSNWPVFLAMLHWLLSLVKETIGLDDLDLNGFQDLQLDNGSTNPDDSVIDNEESFMNKLFINYALKSYKSFLSFGEDDYSEFFNDMQNEYSNYLNKIQRKTELNLELNQELQETFQNCKQKYNLYHDELERTNALKTDVSKFQNYIEIQKQRQMKWPSIIDKVKNDIENIKESIKSINKEKQDIISDLEKKTLTLKDIENLHIERANLTSNLNQIDAKQVDLKEAIEKKLNDMKSVFNDLQEKINHHNQSIYNILNNISLLSLGESSIIEPSNLIIKPLNDEFQNSKFGCSPNEIIPILPNLRNSINSLKGTVQSHTNALQDEILQIQENMDDLKLSLVSYTDQIEELEDSLNKSRKEYNDLNEKYTTDSSNKQFELEDRAKEIRLFTLQHAENKKNIETKWKETEKLYKNTISSVNEQRSQLVCDIAQCLDYVVNFKSDVMTDLENLAMEVNSELKEQIK